MDVSSDGPVRGGPRSESVPELVAAAAAGDRDAWDAMVARYTPLVMSVARGYPLQDSDVRDVVQTVWLRLIEHLDALREPRALPSWLITTTRNETLRLLKAHGRTRPTSPWLDTDTGLVGTTITDGSIDADLLRVERREAVLQALAELGDRDRRLICMLSHDPPLSYAEIGRALAMAVGAIGPTRARILDKVRHHPAVAALAAADAPAERSTAHGRPLGN